jgi:hypothetical protein
MFLPKVLMNIVCDYTGDEHILQWSDIEKWKILFSINSRDARRIISIPHIYRRAPNLTTSSEFKEFKQFYIGHEFKIEVLVCGCSPVRNCEWSSIYHLAVDQGDYRVVKWIKSLYYSMPQIEHRVNVMDTFYKNGGCIGLDIYLEQSGYNNREKITQFIHQTGDITALDWLYPEKRVACKIPKFDYMFGRRTYKNYGLLGLKDLLETTNITIMFKIISSARFQVIRRAIKFGDIDTVEWSLAICRSCESKPCVFSHQTLYKYAMVWGEKKNYPNIVHLFTDTYTDLFSKKEVGYHKRVCYEPKPRCNMGNMR